MRAYVWGWRLAAAAVTGLAALALVVTSGWGPTTVTVTVVAMLTGGLSYAWRESCGPASLSVRGWAIGSASGVLMFLGLPLVVGRGAFLVLALLGLTSPTLARRLGRRLLPVAARPGPARVPPGDPVLTLAWFDTTSRLRAAATPREALAVVQERAQLLDALEQRDPATFQAWLGSPAA